MRARLQARHAVGALAVASASLVSVAPAASGARPVGGARYIGHQGGVKIGTQGEHLYPAAKLRVSRSARSFAASSATLDCADGTWTTVPVHGSAGRRSPVAVGRDGRFTAAGRKRRVGYVLRGRFVTRNRARIVYTVRAPARSRSRPWLCHGRSRGSIVLYRNGKVPFSDCRSQRAPTLLWAGMGRVFQQLKFVHGSAFVTHLYLCGFTHPSKRFDLGENVAPDSTFEEFSLAGSLVAFFRGGCAMCLIESRSIEARDFRDGSIVRKAPQAWIGPWGGFLGYPAYYRLEQYVLNENGSLAWTLSRYSLDGPPSPLPRQEVWAFDSGGQRLLDYGPEIDVRSLALHGSTLTWTNADTTRSATLD